VDERCISVDISVESSSFKEHGSAAATLGATSAALALPLFVPNASGLLSDANKPLERLSKYSTLLVLVLLLRLLLPSFFFPCPYRPHQVCCLMPTKQSSGYPSTQPAWLRSASAAQPWQQR
jgi:hypothetical protein